MSIGCAWSRFTKAAVLTGAMALLVAPPLFAEEPASEAPLAAPDAGASTEPDVPSDAGVPPLEATPAPSVAPVAPPQPSPKPVACRRKDPLARVDAFLFDVPELDKLAAAEDDGDPKRAVLATIDTKAIARRAFRTLLETELRRLKLEYGTESGAKWADASRISASDAEHAGADGQKCFDFLLLPQIRRKEAAWDGDELDLDVEISIAVFERTADGSFRSLVRGTRHNAYSSHWSKTRRRSELRKAECPDAVASEAKSAADQGAHAKCRVFEAVGAATIELAVELTRLVPAFRRVERLIALRGGGVGIAAGESDDLRYAQPFVVVRRDPDGNEERLGFAKVVSLGAGGEEGPSRLRFRMGDAPVGAVAEQYPTEFFHPMVGPTARYHDRGPLGKKMAFGGNLTVGVGTEIQWPSETLVNVGFSYLRDDHINYFPLTIGYEMVFHTLPRLDFVITPLAVQGELAWVKWKDLYSGQIKREWTVGIGAEAGLQLWLSPRFGFRATAGYYQNFREVELDGESLGGEYGGRLVELTGIPDITSTGGVGIGNLSGPMATFSLMFVD